ncbi:MAG: hypothetical protein LVO36_02445 [Nitrosopumilus sp. (ex Thoosa mismalolli)]|nr:hypothetical protein [Nitrosopumilus sp. (ex Thoosa mismalolli)]
MDRDDKVENAEKKILGKTVKEWKKLSLPQLGEYDEHNAKFFVRLGEFMIEDRFQTTH